jgi:hypothetical protein
VAPDEYEQAAQEIVTKYLGGEHMHLTESIVAALRDRYALIEKDVEPRRPAS